MIAVVLASVGALIYGAADFLGGFAARRLGAWPATAAAAASGLVLLVALAPLVGAEWVAGDIAWGVLSGVFGAAAVVLLYACLAIGPMSILSPLTAVVTAIAPMLWALTVGRETLGGLGYAGLGLAVVAVVLVGFVPEKGAVRPTLRGIIMAVGSGVAIGGLIICLDQTTDASGLLPLVANRAANTAITGAVVVGLLLRRGGSGRAAEQARRGDIHPQRSRRGWMIAVGCGLADVTANVLLLLALRSGDLSIVSALTALYPAGTILLAAIVLRERIAPVQWVGLAGALAAGVLLGAA